MSRIKPYLLSSPSPEVAVARPGLIQARLIHQSGYYGWMLPTVGSPVCRICRQMAPAALIHLTTSLTLKPPSNPILVLMRPVMKQTVLSLFWTRNLRTRTPTTTQRIAKMWGRGECGKFNCKLPLLSQRGDKEMTGVGGAPPVALGVSHLLGTEILFDDSQICSC